MSGESVAIKIKTQNGFRYFSGWGKNKSVQTAWSIAGAKLFLAFDDNLDPVTEHLKTKKKKFSLVNIGEKEGVDEAYSILIPLEEFRHYTAISKMKAVNLWFIREFALEQLEISKDAALVSFWNGNRDNIPFMKADAFEWAQLARGLAREIKKKGGL